MRGQIRKIGRARKRIANEWKRAYIYVEEPTLSRDWEDCIRFIKDMSDREILFWLTQHNNDDDISDVFDNYAAYDPVCTFVNFLKKHNPEFIRKYGYLLDL